MNRDTPRGKPSGFPMAKLCLWTKPAGMARKAVWWRMEEERRCSRGCFFCKGGREADVIRHFNTAFPNGRAIAPTRTRIRRSHGVAIEERIPLLSGYVFFELSEDEAPEAGTLDPVLMALVEISKDDSVLKLLKYSGGEWRLLGSDDLFAEMLFNTEGNIGLSQAYFDRGDRIRVLDGFLKDYEGNITSVNRKNRTVEVTADLQGKKVIMRLGYELVMSVNTSVK